MGQTFRSGTHDMDAIDFAEMFLGDESQIDPDELRPAVTKKSWRMDCGVAGYDNRFARSFPVPTWQARER